MQSTPSRSAPVHFRERLSPGPLMFVVLLLIVPAVTLMLFPLNRFIALPTALIVYALVSGFLVLTAPTIVVSDDVLYGGQARIPLAQLGNAERLDDARLRVAIGPGVDARAFLLIRGYIHTGVRIEITDPTDPAPYWVLTTRRPHELIAAIERARIG